MLESVQLTLPWNHVDCYMYNELSHEIDHCTCHMYHKMTDSEEKRKSELYVVCVVCALHTTERD